MDIATKVVLIVFAAATGEGVNEFFFLPWLDGLKDKINETVRVQAMRLWSGLVGVGIAWELNLDVFALLGGELRHPLAGNILTGLLIGRGSNWVHELLKRFITETQIKVLEKGLLENS